MIAPKETQPYKHNVGDTLNLKVNTGCSIHKPHWSVVFNFKLGLRNVKKKMCFLIKQSPDVVRNQYRRFFSK